jgi:hypothetical protein
MPRLQKVLPLDPPRGQLSPLDELIFRLNDAAAMYSGAYPQDAINTKLSPTLCPSKVQAVVRYCAGHDEDDVPAIPVVDFRCHQYTLNKFEYIIAYQDDIDLKCAQGTNNLRRPAERGTTVCHYQVPCRLERSPAMHRPAEEGDAKLQRRIKLGRLISIRTQGLACLIKKLSTMFSSLP